MRRYRNHIGSLALALLTHLAAAVTVLALVLLINFCSSRIAKLMMKGRE